MTDNPESPYELSISLEDGLTLEILNDDVPVKAFNKADLLGAISHELGDVIRDYGEQEGRFRSFGGISDLKKFALDILTLTKSFKNLSSLGHEKV